MSTVNSFGAKSTLTVGSTDYEIFRIDTVPGYEKLPFSLKVLLENLLRTEDGANVTKAQIEALGSWDAAAEPDTEIQFTPARVVMQDFTGVPCIVDLATMREAVDGPRRRRRTRSTRSRPPRWSSTTPSSPTSSARENALERNVEIEYERNGERYQFLRWGQTAFDDFKVVPPGTGIVHQVNIEHLAKVIYDRDVDGVLRAYPDTCVGTDSHTTMVNGLGVLGWGVGGIEAEAAMLGQPVSMLIPRVVGFKLSGEIPAGVTATDVVLTITDMLRKHGVVGKFVEFYGEGVASVPLANRATIGNMSPEFGSTAAIFPIDDVTLDYLRLTGRSDEAVALVEAYAKEQKLWHDAAHEPTFSEYLELDLGTVVPSIAGPKRPQDRILLSEAKSQFEQDLLDYADAVDLGLDRRPRVEALVPGIRPGRAPARGRAHDHAHRCTSHSDAPANASKPVPVTTPTGEKYILDHGAVTIAAITSCTNTSNPSVMIAAGLLARKARREGPQGRSRGSRPRSAPGSKVVTDYYEKSGLDKDLEGLGFYTVGYGCTTCIGNSGPLIEEVSAAINENDLAVTAVLSGNRNFEGRINPDVKMNYLASPPLVIAYALAGSMNFDFETDALGKDTDGNDVFLKDIWPDAGRGAGDDRLVDLHASMFTKQYASVFDGDERWKSLPTPDGAIFEWDEDSTYVRKPPYFDGMTMELTPVTRHRGRARAWRRSATRSRPTTSARPATSRPTARRRSTSTEHGVDRKDFNSYGSRRGNHEVMIRGTFANIRLKNQLSRRQRRPVSRAATPATSRRRAARSRSSTTRARTTRSRARRSSSSAARSTAPARRATGRPRARACWASRRSSPRASSASTARTSSAWASSRCSSPPARAGSRSGLDGTEIVSISGLEELNDGVTPKTVHVTADPERVLARGQADRRVRRGRPHRHPR